MLVSPERPSATWLNRDLPPEQHHRYLHFLVLIEDHRQVVVVGFMGRAIDRRHKDRQASTAWVAIGPWGRGLDLLELYRIGFHTNRSTAKSTTAMSSSGRLTTKADNRAQMSAVMARSRCRFMVATPVFRCGAVRGAALLEPADDCRHLLLEVSHSLTQSLVSGGGRADVSERRVLGFLRLGFAHS
jgi:hypothetical protein